MLNYHASDYMSINHQVAINATETFKAKLTFEGKDKSQGVMINEYHTDILNTSKFTEELLINWSMVLLYKTTYQRY